MEDTSIFSDKMHPPKEVDLINALGMCYSLWDKIRAWARAQYPEVIEEWNFSGKKYGWSFRMKDKKRAILYLLPRDGFFRVAFVFGAKAVDAVNASGVNDEIKKELATAKPYAEGRGIRIEIRDAARLQDVKTLIGIKLAH